jgi:hypothetical protein
MTLLHKLWATFHHRADTAESGQENLRAEDGFVPASQVRLRGVLRIF